MVFTILKSQFAVELTTIVTLILTLILALLISRKYIKAGRRSLLYWSAGLWMFFIGVLLEIIFAFGIYSQLLIGAYLLIVAILVELLALGSMELIKAQRAKTVYTAFVIVSTLFLVYTLLASNIGNIITDYIVYGNLPLLVTISSSLITFPAAIILVVIAAKSYLVKKSNKLLSIIAGVIIVSIAGTLYIVQYPAFLYIAEFVGILALWYGFI